MASLRPIESVVDAVVPPLLSGGVWEDANANKPITRTTPATTPNAARFLGESMPPLWPWWLLVLYARTARPHGHAAPSTWGIALCARLGEVGMVKSSGAATVSWSI